MSGAPVADAWRVLDSQPTADAGAIRKAYARRLKAIDPEADPAAFIELRQARDWAMARAATDGEPPVLAVGPAPVPAPPPSSGPPAEPPAEPAPPVDGPDRAAIATLHAMVLDPASTATAADIADQAERVLADPALANIDEAGRMEEFIATLIVQATPRSDALLDPAIRHFRWDADRPELERQPIVGWVAQRQADIDFENALPYRSVVYAGLVRGLRRPELPARPRWTAWRFGTRVEYLLAYLGQLHPTILAGADGGKLDWWAARIAEQKAAPLPVRWWRERWRRDVWVRGIDQRVDWRAVGLWGGIVVMPYLFVWLLLRRGHGMTERAIGFGYLAVLALLVGLGQAPRTSAPSVTPSALSAAAVEPPRYRDFAADVEPVLAGVTSGTVDEAALRARNPALWHALQQQWQAAAAANTAFPAYRTQAGTTLNLVLGAALKKGDDKLLTDYAGAYNARLRWAERGSPDDCVDMLVGISPGPPLSDFADYHGRLVGRAILAGTPPPPPRPARKGARRLFTIPPAIFAEAQRRSLLDKAAFRRALLDQGTTLARCNAHIALVDAAMVDGTPAGLTLLRAIFAPA